MFELICMSLLGLTYIDALINEAKEEKEQKQKEIIRETKISIFCYAIRHSLGYNDVIKLLIEKKLTLDEIKKDAQECERTSKLSV